MSWHIGLVVMPVICWRKKRLKPEMKYESRCEAVRAREGGHDDGRKRSLKKSERRETSKRIGALSA